MRKLLVASIALVAAVLLGALTSLVLSRAQAQPSKPMDVPALHRIEVDVDG